MEHIVVVDTWIAGKIEHLEFLIGEILQTRRLVNGATVMRTLAPYEVKKIMDWNAQISILEELREFLDSAVSEASVIDYSKYSDSLWDK